MAIDPDVYVEKPPPRPGGEIDVVLEYRGRGKPTEVDGE